MQKFYSFWTPVTENNKLKNFIYPMYKVSVINKTDIYKHIRINIFLCIWISLFHDYTKHNSTYIIFFEENKKTYIY